LSFADGFILFVRMFTGGLFLGLIVGGLGLVASYWIKLPLLKGAISLLAAFGVYLLAEKYFQVSGLLAVLVTGLLLNAATQNTKKTDKVSQDFLYSMWRYYAFVAKSMLFILLGISIRPSLLADQWLAIVVGIVAVLIARAAIIFMGLWLIGHLHKSDQFAWQDKGILYWGNIKGSVTIALVLSLPTTLPYSYTIQGITYGVVLFSLLLQAPTLRFLVPHLTTTHSLKKATRE
ncbi:MAG: cation:proton antiporter, partial [Thiotrichaceae bacterium]